jgi:hypothetical protein
MKRIVIAAMVIHLGTIFAAAQEWPTKLVKIVVPTKPNSSGQAPH